MEERQFFFFFFFFLVFFITSSNLFVPPTLARFHYHKPKHHGHEHNDHISIPPMASPPSSSALPDDSTPSSPPPEEAPSPSLGENNSPSNYAGPVFNVVSFGAVGDAINDDTQAFKAAWDAARLVENATLLVPGRYSFLIQPTIFTGPCQNGFTFQVDGTVMPPDGPEAWPQSNNKRQWLVFYRADEMTLQGGGLIDGKGQKWWNLPCKPHRGVNGTTLPGPCDSPVALRFFMSSNVTVRGLRINNSPQFHFRFDNCRNVVVDTITINSPALSPNTDGIHLENTNNVAIHNSIISNASTSNPPSSFLQTGDDCVSIGSGSSNVDIRNVTCGPSHGISIGSLGNHNSRACVWNISVSKTTIRHSDNGVRIKTWQGGSGSVSGVTFSEIYMDVVRNPIIIDQYYCLTKSCANQTSAVYVSDVAYLNIKGTYDVRSPPMHFGCSDAVPCTNLTLSEIELLPAQGDVVHDPYCWNAYGDPETLTIPPVSCLLEGFPKSTMDAYLDKC